MQEKQQTDMPATRAIRLARNRRTAMWTVALVLATLPLLLSLTLASVALPGQTLCANRNTAELELPTDIAPRPANPSNAQNPWPAWAITH
jgi:hypothetical protein